MIHYDYEYYDSSAFSSGALRIGQDSLIYDGTFSVNPYKKATALLPVLLQEKVYGDSIYFVRDAAMDLINRTISPQLNVTNVEVGVSGGSYMPLSTTAKKGIGIKHITTSRIGLNIRVTLTDGSIYLFPFELDNGNMELMVSVWTNNCVDSNYYFWSGSALTFQGYDETTPSQAMIQYKFYYHLNGANNENNCTDKKLRKPIIIMDGIDFRNKARVIPDKIYDMLAYKSSSSADSANLADTLRKQGYDIIVVNFPVYDGPGFTDRDGGTDYIERNAMGIVKLIQYVNAQLTANGSTEQIVVGPSMGGQISRYALKYMKNNAMNHNTRPFVSFDSPNDGANVPMSIQSAMWFGSYIQVDDATRLMYNQTLRSTAAKQMLIHQAWNLYWPYGAFPTDYMMTTEHPFHTTWQNMINSYGYPNNLRKVALSNGTTKSDVIKYPWEDALIYKARKKEAPFKNKLFAHILLKNTAPANQSGLVFSGFIYGSRSMDVNFTSSYRGNLDGVQGSMLSSYTKVKDSLKIGDFYVASTWLGGSSYGVGVLYYYHNDYHTFMPTVSTLGFKNSNFDWNNDIDRNLLCINEINFDNYFTASSEDFSGEVHREAHVQLTEKAAHWISEEIQYGKQGCPVICSDNIASTSVVMCSSGSTFTISPAPPAGSETQWIYDTSAFTEVSSTNSTIKLKTIDGVSSTNDSLIAIIKPAIGGVQCGASKRLVKKMVSPEFFDIHVATPSGIDTNFTATVTPHIPGNTYSWSKDGIVWEANTLSNIDTFRKLVVSSPPYPHFFVKVYNSGCTGALIELSEQYMVEGFMPWSPKPAKPTTISITPNPTTDHWTISLPANWNNEQSIQYSVVSIDGKEVLSTISPYASSYLLDATQLPKGFYFLKITNGALTEQVKLVK